ncbi:trigger factor [Mycoplasma sp. 1654_15]|uniref:trigger factor n=1 Tax=Mycoplasma sp. 1654_15 TaxID=2725994 RepID=UPI001449DEEF|nr:trigger factor [Mycoplasma sp. 1654_15]QJB70979.1 trigger factor [Mycoplasma sp. 1654_15]
MVKRELLAESSELKITVKPEENVWKKTQEKANKALIKNLKVDGFRKGSVPANIAKKYISEASILREAVSLIAPELETEARKNIIEDDNVLDSPIYKIEDISTSNLEISFLYPVYPTLNLPDYKHLKTKFIEPKVGKEDIDLQIQRLLETSAATQETDKPIKKRDIVNFNFKGFIDGQAFEGGEAENFDLKIGSGSFIAGFEDQLVGMKKGDKKEITVTFPENYHVTAYAGKEAKFKIKINQVNELVLPKLDEEFIKKLSLEDVKNEKDLRAYLEKLTFNEKLEQNRVIFQKESFAEIQKQVQIPISEKLLLNEIRRLEKLFENNLKSQGFTVKEYLEITKFTEEDIKLQMRTESINLLKNAFIYAEIAKLEKIFATAADYDIEYGKLAKFYGKSIEDIKKTFPLAQLQVNITNSKVLDKLIEYNSTKSSKVSSEKEVKTAKSADKKEVKQTKSNTESSVKKNTKKEATSQTKQPASKPASKKPVKK